MKSGVTKQIVIVGGGFAGLNCAERLARHPEFQITLLDRNNYQQFQPLLYQVATGTLSPDNAAFNLRAVLASHENVDIKMTEIISVDLVNRTARSSEGVEYKGDYLVLAAGAEANFFGIPGVSRFACPLYSLQDAQQLKSRLLELLEAADRSVNETPESLLRVVVIGGGPTGVETAGAIADLFQRTPKSAFKNVNLRGASVTLVDRADSVLVPFTKKAQEYTTATLRERGVKLQLGAIVSEVTASDVVLSDGMHIPAGLVIWAGGLKASALSSALGIAPGRGGRVDVKSDLTLEGFPGVYALGDFANFKQEDGSALPQLASVAQQAGRHCARNIAADAVGEPQSAFNYFDKGIMAMVGRDAAVAEVGAKHYTLTGLLAFIAWLGVHALLLTTVRARLETFLEWGWEYFGNVHVSPILDRPRVSLASESEPPST